MVLITALVDAVEDHFLIRLLNVIKVKTGKMLLMTISLRLVLNYA